MSAPQSAPASPGPLRSDCPGCGASMRPFFSFTGVPVNSCILLDTVDAARAYPRGDVVLGFCDDCGFICNLAFDARLAEYSSRYEETQGFSPTFRAFHERLARTLIERYGLRGKDVLEIGCGKGEFLALLCQLGGNRGVGFDPGYDSERAVLNGVADVEVISDFYSPSYADRDADFVCCKMTLEHIPETAAFVRLAKRALRNAAGSVMYFMVPEALRIVRDCAFEDVYYEHCSYFTAGSLARLFRSAGLEALQIGTEYAGQYLSIEATIAPTHAHPATSTDDLEDLRGYVDSFAARCGAKIASWRAVLDDASRRGEVVVWGSGSKAVSFLNAVDVDRRVARVVDINPYRQGYFMAGSGQPIIPPDALRESPPSTIVIMNAVYREEIARSVVQLGLTPEYFAL
jgi:SAM-dependent methyltransferase